MFTYLIMTQVLLHLLTKAHLFVLRFLPTSSTVFKFKLFHVISSRVASSWNNMKLSTHASGKRSASESF